MNNSHNLDAGSIGYGVIIAFNSIANKYFTTNVIAGVVPGKVLIESD